MQIFVFKTNIRFKKHLNDIAPHLISTKGIHRWNLDFQDRDKILRIEASNLQPHLVEEMLKDAGYSCEELKD